MDGGHHHIFCARRILTGAGYDVLRGVLLDFLAADGGIGAPDACKQQAQVFVDLRGGAYGGTGVPGDDTLLDGNGWGEALDIVAFGLVHTTEKLTGIARQALHIATLTLGIERVESQRRLAAA